MILRSLVLENHHEDEPLSFNYSRFLPHAISLICVLGIFCVTYAELKANYFPSTPFSQTTVILLKIFIHGSYLILVFWLLIFSNPPENIYRQQLVYPTLLLLAYVIYFFSFVTPYFTNNISGDQWACFLKKLSYDTFIVLYTLWALRDFYEYKSEKERKLEKITWFTIETIAIILLCYYTFTGKDISSIVNAKDVAVFFSLVAWIILRTGGGLVKSTSYVNIYENFFKHIITPDFNELSIKIPNSEQITNILDFGCGSGLRIIQFFEMAKINPKDIYLMGYDKIPNWEDKFVDNLDEIVSKVSFINREELINSIQQIDLIHISHVLYEEGAYKNLKHILQKTKKGTIIIFRGNGPNSWLFLYSYIKSKDWFNSNKSHYWNEKWLNKLCANCELKRVNRSLGSTPDLIITQNYDISKQSNRNDFKSFLNYLYDEISDNFSSKYFSQLFNYQKAGKIPCDDILYIYIKQ